MTYTIEEFCNDVEPVINTSVQKMLIDAGCHLTDEKNVYVCSGPHYVRRCLALAHEEAQTLMKAGLPGTAEMADICHYLMLRLDKTNKETPEIWNRNLVQLNVKQIKESASLDREETQ